MNKVLIGKFIAEQRKQKGLTQRELAEKLNVTDKAVSKWETGKGYPDIEILESLSELFCVSINDILSGEIVPQENKEKEADKNLVEEIKNTKSAKQKGKIIALVLSFIIFIVSIFAVYQAVTAEKYEAKAMEIYSKAPVSVFGEISAAIHNEFYISNETVCTYSHVRYDENGDITYIDMELWDEHTFKRIQIKYWLHDETGLPQIRLTAHQGNQSLHMDGIHFKKYIKFLSTSDIGELVRKSGHSTENGFSIDSDYMMSKTIEENSNVEICPGNYSYLYVNGEIVPFVNTSQISGKLYEISVWSNDNMDEDGAVQGSCCLINIPR